MYCCATLGSPLLNLNQRSSTKSTLGLLLQWHRPLPLTGLSSLTCSVMVCDIGCAQLSPLYSSPYLPDVLRGFPGAPTRGLSSESTHVTRPARSLLKIDAFLPDSAAVLLSIYWALPYFEVKPLTMIYSGGSLGIISNFYVIEIQM